jgi:hypothetical protein
MSLDYLNVCISGLVFFGRIWVAANRAFDVTLMKQRVNLFGFDGGPFLIKVRRRGFKRRSVGTRIDRTAIKRSGGRRLSAPPESRGERSDGPRPVVRRSRVSVSWASHSLFRGDYGQSFGGRRCSHSDGPTPQAAGPSCGATGCASSRIGEQDQFRQSAVRLGRGRNSLQKMPNPGAIEDQEMNSRSIILITRLSLWGKSLFVRS